MSESVLRDNDVTTTTHLSGEEVTIKEKGGIDPSLYEGKKVDVSKFRVQYDEEIRDLEKKLEKTKMQMTDTNSKRKEHLELARQATEAAVQKEKEAKHMRQVEAQKEKIKQKAIAEEWRFEEQRSRQHQKAVEAEEERAKAEAIRVLKEREAGHCRKLIDVHKKGAQNSEELLEAQKVALREIHSNLQRSKEEVELRVTAETIPTNLESKPFEINVDVKPQHIPEARIGEKVMHAKVAHAHAKVKETGGETQGHKIDITTKNIKEKSQTTNISEKSKKQEVSK